MNRREFLQAGSAATSGLLLLKSSTAFGYQANSAVSFGIIGTGGRGRFVGGLMAKDPRARLAMICDLYADRLDLAPVARIAGRDGEFEQCWRPGRTPAAILPF